MKRVVLLCMLLGGMVSGFAQFSLPDFNRERLSINKTGFTVLSAWSVANIVDGAIGTGVAHGQARYFHEMNLIWGAVNFSIALPGYLGSRRGPGNLSWERTLHDQSAVEKTFIFNAGLDLTYLAAGAWCLQKAKTASNGDKYRGFGNSILMQGGALLLFDAIMFGTHNGHGRKLYRALSGLQISGNGVGMNWRW